MTEDKEKRFQRIMDKLYRSPKPKPPPPSGTGGTNAQHKGRRRELGSRELVENSTRHAAAGIGTREGRTPPCRPWDRSDLMKRLATFKAMTWFGKPKAIDPVNCARRGWVNVEVDTLACGACGARLLFSAPSSWTLPQVEKAAAVFSLKLDNGHKLLCPWIDNICDEALAFFPPTPPPALIESYKERSTALLQLSALPVISSSAFDYMKSPQLEDFLAKSSSLMYRLDGGMKLTVSSGNMVFDSASIEDVSSQYYQALKIISLCGWEPRVLPYIVDRVDSSSHYVKMAKAVDSSPELQSNKNPGFVVYSSTVSGESDGKRGDQVSLADYDPASVVLDCKLCGACAGLWAFATISRPMELFNLTESPEEDEQSGPATGSNGSTSDEKTFSLNLTIAGGPPPTRQSFKPRITLPIVTRHLRSAFGSNGDIRNCASVDAQGETQLNTQSSLEFEEGNIISNLAFPSETPGMLKRKRNENEYSTSGGSSCYIQPLPPSNANVNVDANTPSSSGKTGCEEGSVQVSEEVNKCLQEATQDLVQSPMVTEDAENRRSTDTETEHEINLQPGNSSCLTTDRILPKDDSISENTSVAGTAGIYMQDNNGYSGMNLPSHSITSEVNHNSQNIAFGVIPEGHATFDVEVNKNPSGKDDVHREGGDEIHAMQSHINDSAGSQNVLGSKTLNSVDAEVVALCTSRNNPSSSSQWDNTDKFDPIGKHRPFCPWIAQMHDDIMPGWKLTLRAVVKDKCSPRAEPPSSFSDEDPLLELVTDTEAVLQVDDPIVSVRKLFTSPPSKRFKGSQLTQ
ncbi:hypothetical protein Taro_003141 [Colocasia esculenta]|uniref:C3HC-type domain-containing protein n=1 Tax=Colocasia esculenta TaxID=4460 RepID=A0A843TKN2_COLES|nr:hypothetical protein [Colocasia esculenta]